MNDYLTPRRRHSSLFQRMEDEIIKISRKLSAAKQHKVTHTDTFNRHHQSPGGNTVRRAKEFQLDNSKELTRKFSGLADRTNLEPRPRQPIRKLKFNHVIEGLVEPYEPENNEEVSRLTRQNRQLQSQLHQAKVMCEEQSYKLGYLRAEHREVASQLEATRLDSYRENLYLTKLVEGYKIKVNKYKRILNEEESLEIEVGDI